MEKKKELFAEWGLWSLVEDISDDGDGEGDNLQLTPEGERWNINNRRTQLLLRKHKGVK